MLPVEDQLSILVYLSRADNFVAAEESKLIYTIGERNGLTPEEVEVVVDNPKPIPNLDNLSPDEKFDFLFNMIHLMKVDSKIHEKEIEFCERLAFKLGYKPGVIADLSAYIYSDPKILTDRSFLRSVADQHAIPKKKED